MSFKLLANITIQIWGVEKQQLYWHNIPDDQGFLFTDSSNGFGFFWLKDVYSVNEVNIQLYIDKAITHPRPDIYSVSMETQSYNYNYTVVNNTLDLTQEVVLNSLDMEKIDIENSNMYFSRTHSDTFKSTIFYDTEIINDGNSIEENTKIDFEFSTQTTRMRATFGSTFLTMALTFPTVNIISYFLLKKYSRDKESVDDGKNLRKKAFLSISSDNKANKTKLTKKSKDKNL